MVIEPNSKTSRLREKMGTVQFMTIDILNGESYQAFHNCKSIYQLCFIALLQKHTSLKIEKYAEAIIDSSKKLFDLVLAKIGFIGYLLILSTLRADVWKKKIMKHLRPKNIIKKNLVKYLIELTDYFYRHVDISSKQLANYFKAYSDILNTTVDRAKCKKSSRANEKKPSKKGKNSEITNLSWDFCDLKFKYCLFQLRKKKEDGREKRKTLFILMKKKKKKKAQYFAQNIGLVSIRLFLQNSQNL